MAKPGQVIENGRGHRIIFRKTSANTNGELLQFEEYLAPKGLRPPEHIHLRQVERLQILSRTMSAKISGRQQRIRAGDEVAIPAGMPHRWWNDEEEELHLGTEFRPALHFEWIIERDLMEP